MKEILNVSVFYGQANIYYVPFNNPSLNINDIYALSFDNANISFIDNVFTLDDSSRVMLLHVNSDNDVSDSILTNGLVLTDFESNIQYSFVGNSNTNIIYSNKDLVDHYFGNIDTIYYTGIQLSDEPLYKYSKISFDFKDDFPMSAREVDFTLILEYTCSGNIADMIFFKDSLLLPIPDTFGNRVLMINKYYAKTHTLHSYTKAFTNEYELVDTVENFVEYPSVHLCGCDANDFIHVIAERTNDGEFFMLHNISAIQGILSNDTTYLNSGTINNIFLGTDAGYSNAGGINNVFIGNNSGKLNIGGTDNVFMGYKCGENNQGGNNNVFIGTECGVDNSIGYNNVFIGYKCGYTNTTGFNNIFIGYECGYKNTTGHDNVFIGQQAGYFNETGSYNMIIGAETKGNVEDSNIDYYNTIRMIKKSVEGFIAETKLAIDRVGDIEGDTSDNNTVIGVKAAKSYVDGTGVGSNNVFCGSFNASTVTSANHNTVVGALIAPLAEELHSNTLIGSVCAGNVDNEFGTNNTSIGKMASLHQTNSNYNISIGEMCSSNKRNSDRNISIGQSSAAFMTNGHNNICIGNQSGYMSSYNYTLQFLNMYMEIQEDNSIHNIIISSNISHYLVSPPLTLLPNVDASNIQLDTLTVDVHDNIVFYSNIYSTYLYDSNIIDANIYSNFHKVESNIEGNIYVHIAPNSYMSGETLDYFFDVYNVEETFPNIEFSNVEVGDVLDSNISVVNYVITFLNNSYTNHFIYSSQCIGSNYSQFNIVYNPDFLSGYITISNNTVIHKRFIDVNPIQFISTYIS